MVDEMDFLTDDDEDGIQVVDNCWNILIVDDDISVHEATKYALSGFKFFDKTIRWVEAYSSEEAKRAVEKEKDIALLFLDVVMETDDAGLKFAKWFREKNINPSTRIILRTGQPGQAPERQIIVNYDLHDYKTKTELSSDKLFTTTVAALRAYYDMHRLETTRVGLEGVIKATGNLFQVQSMYEYAKSVLVQVGSILDIRSSGIICAQSKKGNSWEILAESGTFVSDYDKILSVISECSLHSAELVEKQYMIRILSESEDMKYAIYLEPVDALTDIQTQMLLMFCTNISMGISNIKLYNNLLDSHRATVMSLAQITESRDHETGEHVLRLSKGTEFLARALYEQNIYPEEITEKTSEVIGLSSTLHDIGKIAIPDAVLLKPGKLTDEEFAVIKTHPEKGSAIIQTAIDYAGDEVEYLHMGKLIALYHHERWDGTGYPTHIKGKEIPVEARITTIVDVFDALINRRCYKDAYSIEDSLQIIAEGRGTFFDPKITDVFIKSIDGIYDYVWKE